MELLRARDGCFWRERLGGLEFPAFSQNAVFRGVENAREKDAGSASLGLVEESEAREVDVDQRPALTANSC